MIICHGRNNYLDTPTLHSLCQIFIEVDMKNNH